MIRILWAGPLALAALVGCGSEESRYKLVPVKGTITLNDQPLGGAHVSFAPDDQNATKTPGVDATGPSGNYKLMFKGRSGVAPGKYKVTVTPPDPAAAESANPIFKDDPAMLGFEQEARQIAANRGKKIELGAKAEFEAEVPDDGGTFDFDVKTAKVTPAKKK